MKNRKTKHPRADCTSSTTTQAFGKVHHYLVDEVSLNATLRFSQDIFQDVQRGSPAEEVSKKDDELRAQVGALHDQISRRIEEDIRKLNLVLGYTWKCLWVSLFTTKLRPHKYFRICGPAIEGYRLLVSILANKDGRRWGFSSQEEYSNIVFRTQESLRRMEKEYRESAIAVAQIGIGIGGMLLGLIGLLLSVMLFVLSTQC